MNEGLNESVAYLNGDLMAVPWIDGGTRPASGGLNLRGQQSSLGRARAIISSRTRCGVALLEMPPARSSRQATSRERFGCLRSSGPCNPRVGSLFQCSPDPRSERRARKSGTEFPSDFRYSVMADTALRMPSPSVRSCGRIKPARADSDPFVRPIRPRCRTLLPWRE